MSTGACGRGFGGGGRARTMMRASARPSTRRPRWELVAVVAPEEEHGVREGVHVGRVDDHAHSDFKIWVLANRGRDRGARGRGGSEARPRASFGREAGALGETSASRGERRHSQSALGSEGFSGLVNSALLPPPPRRDGLVAC